MAYKEIARKRFLDFILAKGEKRMLRMGFQQLPEGYFTRICII
jgi:hypothetical protein